MFTFLNAIVIPKINGTCAFYRVTLVDNQNRVATHSERSEGFLQNDIFEGILWEYTSRNDVTIEDYLEFETLTLELKPISKERLRRLCPMCYCKSVNEDPF